MRELTPQQQQVCSLVGAGLTQRAAAEKVGVHEDVVSRWFTGAEGDDLRAAMAAAVTKAVDDKLAMLMADATGALSIAVRDTNPDVATKAADVIFRRRAQVEKYEHGLRQLELQREALAAKVAEGTTESIGLIEVPSKGAKAQ